MIIQLDLIEQLFLRPHGYVISELTVDTECAAYAGYNFAIASRKIKFRIAKTTPTKGGLFVTLWKRNAAGETEPYEEDESFDDVFIYTEQGDNRGFFAFSKELLCQYHILTTSEKEGKRGFRLYPPWVETDNKQAQKTQAWQCNSFITITNPLHTSDTALLKLLDFNI